MFFQGSGCEGCESSYAGGAAGALGFALIALLLGLGLRRRHGALVLLPLALLVLPVPASAQSNGPAIDIQRFDPVPQSRGFALVRDGHQPTRLEVGSFLSVNYGLRPLELGVPGQYTRTGGVVEHLVGFDLGVSVAFNKWVQVGVQVPFLQIQGSPADALAVSAGFGHANNGFAPGDTTVALGIAPVRESDGHAVSFSVAPRVVLPTGNAALFVGSNAYGIGLDAALSKRWKHFRFSVNLGFQVNTLGRALANLRPDDELRWGVGLGVPLLDDQLEIQLEWVGGTVIDPAAHAAIGAGVFTPTQTPSEIDLGVFVNPEQGPVWFRVGGGRGIGPGFGSPELRLFGMVGFDVGCKPCQEQVVERVVETMIPDPDPDRDEVLGDADQCPHDPEDRDGFEDEDGCPEWDNDQDTVHDACDRCPTEKETLNGVDDHDGCADKALAQIDVEKQEIVILDKVYFDLDKATIKKASHDVLDAVVQVMSQFPAIESIEIQGHTDSRAPDDYNLDLSQRRAEAVLTYLVEHGIEAGRLAAKGYGETTPIVPNAEAEDDHAMNRRVQFKILKTSAGAPIVKEVEEAKPTAPE